MKTGAESAFVLLASPESLEGLVPPWWQKREEGANLTVPPGTPVALISLYQIAATRGRCAEPLTLGL